MSALLNELPARSSTGRVSFNEVLSKIAASNAATATTQKTARATEPLDHEAAREGSQNGRDAENEH